MNCEVYALRGGLPSMAERHRQAGRKLLCRGIEADRIKKYGFAFEGKEVLIG